MTRTTRRTPSADFKRAKEELIFFDSRMHNRYSLFLPGGRVVYAPSRARENASGTAMYTLQPVHSANDVDARMHVRMQYTYSNAKSGTMFVPDGSTERQHHRRRLPDAP